MFGGRLPNNHATNKLLIFTVHTDKTLERPRFKIIKPKMIGMPPPERYSHTISLVPKVNLVAIYGGRNDFLPSNVIMSDLWIIKLYNMEWVRVAIGGNTFSVPRCNHSAFGNDS